MHQLVEAFCGAVHLDVKRLRRDCIGRSSSVASVGSSSSFIVGRRRRRKVLGVGSRLTAGLVYSSVEMPFLGRSGV